MKHNSFDEWLMEMEAAVLLCSSIIYMTTISAISILLGLYEICCEFSCISRTGNISVR